MIIYKSIAFLAKIKFLSILKTLRKSFFFPFYTFLMGFYYFISCFFSNSLSVCFTFSEVSPCDCVLVL